MLDESKVILKYIHVWTWSYFGMFTQVIHCIGILSFEQITQIPLILIFFFFHPPVFLLLLLQLLWCSATKEHTGNAERLTYIWQPAHEALTRSEQFFFSTGFFLLFETSTSTLLSRLSESKCLSTNELSLGWFGFF